MGFRNVQTQTFLIVNISKNQSDTLSSFVNFKMLTYLKMYYLFGNHFGIARISQSQTLII